MEKPTTYRPNAAVIVTDGHGRVLLCERIVPPGVVQTVQGGIDEGESPEEAARRELEEELGLSPEDYEITEYLLGTYKYDWSDEIREAVWKNEFLGQDQHFFLAKVKPDTVFDLEGVEAEFARVYWGTPEELLNKVWEAKRPGLRAAIDAFRAKKGKPLEDERL